MTVAAGDLAIFGAYVLVLVATPGVLLWRFGRGRSRSLAEDIGPGLALGYVLEVLAYFAARGLGQPRAVAVAPIAVLVAFAVVPRLRRWWRADPEAERPPLAWTVATTAVAAGVLAWSWGFFLRRIGPDYPFNDADLPFQLALIGEVRHHLPPAVPWVHGETLAYHWFAYADLAATTWVTGLDPQVVLLHLAFLPMLAAMPYALGALTHQVTGRWWPGPVAALLALAAMAPYPYGWAPPEVFRSNGLGPVEDGVMLRFGLFSSPTQTFAAVIAAGLVMVLVDLLRGPDPDGRGPDRRGGDGHGVGGHGVGGHGAGGPGWRWRTWVVLAAFVAVLCGAKATYLPLILCALLLIVAVTLIGARRWPGGGHLGGRLGGGRLGSAAGVRRRALLAVAIVLPGILFAQLVLFRGESQGMAIEPLGGLTRYSLGVATGAGTAVITAVTVLAWAFLWGGAVATWARWRDPAYLLLSGIGLAAFGAVLLVDHGSYSQTWFLVAARPYLAVAAVAGLALLAGKGPVWLAAAGVFGLAVASLVPMLGRPVAPDRVEDGLRATLTAVALPNAWLIVAVAAAGVAAAAARGPWADGRWHGRAMAAGAARGPWADGRWHGRAMAAGAAVVATALGVTAFPAVGVVRDQVRAPVLPAKPLWAGGTREAAAWLRGHTDSSDLMATNAHCRIPAAATCDNRRFWFAAFAQRRFLVEGWGYTPTANRLQVATGMPAQLVPYWEPDLLAANDAAFHRPGPDTVDALRDLGVDWLVVDERDPAVRGDLLRRWADLRFRSGQVAVYEV